ncbi:hypothetical protein BD311DRAFT_441256 [Dichomitus squalens]|uniref:Uncharacterized protein n=1 Tax=Dichomitus squalens TaxID=114155 RepID=A0A4Q9N0D4_9APHY|nr:hypothetical protein BD311DRAFT_441256 [Dichomitus squalens]
MCTVSSFLPIVLYSYHAFLHDPHHYPLETFEAVLPTGSNVLFGLQSWLFVHSPALYRFALNYLWYQYTRRHPSIRPSVHPSIQSPIPPTKSYAHCYARSQIALSLPLAHIRLPPHRRLIYKAPATVILPFPRDPSLFSMRSWVQGLWLPYHMYALPYDAPRNRATSVPYTRRSRTDD